MILVVGEDINDVGGIIVQIVRCFTFAQKDELYCTLG